MKRILVLAAGLTLGLPPAGAQAADSVTIQLKWVSQAQFAGYFVAKSKGFYKEAGLDVTIKPGGPDVAPPQVIAGGGADVVVDWMPSALASREKGVPLVNISQTFYEAGHMMYIHMPSMKQMKKDVAAFYHDYDRLRSLEPGAVLPGPPLTVTATAGNKLHGETYGIEFAPSWQVTDSWRLQAGYTFLQNQLHRDAGSGDTTSELDEGRNPHHQFSLRSSADLPHNLEVDCAVRYVESLPGFQIPSYIVVDVRLAWRPFKNFEVAIVGQNLLDDRHPEFQSLFIPIERTEVQHSVYGKVTWRY